MLVRLMLVLVLLLVLVHWVLLVQLLSSLDHIRC